MCFCDTNFFKVSICSFRLGGRGTRLSVPRTLWCFVAKHCLFVCSTLWRTHPLGSGGAASPFCLIVVAFSDNLVPNPHQDARFIRA